jgi:hypothetical protein
MLRLTPDESINLRRVFARKLAREAKDLRAKSKTAKGGLSKVYRVRSGMLVKYARRVRRIGTGVFILEGAESVIEALCGMRSAVNAELFGYFDNPERGTGKPRPTGRGVMGCSSINFAGGATGQYSHIVN